MIRPYIDNNQGLGIPGLLGGRNGSRNVISRYTLGLPNTPGAQLNQQVSAPAPNAPTAPVNNKSDSWSLGNLWNDTKKTVWGTPVSTLGKNADGKFNTSILNDTQWEQFYDAGGKVGAQGQLYNPDGSAFDLESLGVDTSKLGKQTEGGLGGLFSGEGLDKAGKAAENVGLMFGAYQAADNIFGQGAKSRKEAEKRMKADFEQRYAMNQMAMNKFREDNEHFKQQRAAITASY